MTRTALVVDDPPSFRASARAVLEAAGFEVLGEAESGADALTAITRLDPDLVLLDVQLPDMTGFDVCAALEDGAGPPCDVILVSSRDAADYGDAVAESCARGFIAKADLSGETIEALLA